MADLTFEYALTPKGLEHDRRIVTDDTGRILRVEGAGGGPYDGALALPAMVNAHSHVFQRAMCGLGESRAGQDSFWSWRNSMYALAARIDPDALYVIACQAYAEMLAAGFTSVGEFHYLHHLPDGTRGPAMAEAVVSAARATGIRLRLLPVYYRSGGFGVRATPAQQRFVHSSPEAFGELLAELAGYSPGVAPHSLRAVPVAELGELVEIARGILGDDAPIHLHIAEQVEEVRSVASTTV